MTVVSLKTTMIQGIQSLLTCSPLSCSWSHCLACWKPSGEGWQPKTCRMTGLFRFCAIGGLCTIWPVYSQKPYSCGLYHLYTTWDLVTVSHTHQSPQVLHTVNRTLSWTLLWSVWLCVQVSTTHEYNLAHFRGALAKWKAVAT